MGYMALKVGDQGFEINRGTGLDTTEVQYVKRDID